jgi:hypothetical protein
LLLLPLRSWSCVGNAGVGVVESLSGNGYVDVMDANSTRRDGGHGHGGWRERARGRG